MYARSPDETLPQSSTSRYPLSLQLYPYHQQGFHQRTPQQTPQESPATFYPDYADTWSPVAQRPRPNVSPPVVGPQTPGYPDLRPQPACMQVQPPGNPRPPHPSHGFPFHNGYNNPRPRNSSLSYASPSVPTPQVSHPYSNSSFSAASGLYSSPSRPLLPQQHPTQPPAPPPSVIPDASQPHLQSQYPAASTGPPPLPPVTIPQSVAPIAPRLDPLPPTNEEPSPVDDEEDIELALAISQSEMFQRQQEEMKMSNQEDEDLAKALAESLQTAGRSLHLFGGESSSMATTSTSNLQQSSILEKNYIEPSPEQSQVNLPTQNDLDLVLPPPLAPVVPQVLPSSYIVEDDLDFGLANHRKWQIPAAPSSSQEGPSNGKGRVPGSPVSTKDGFSAPPPSGYSSETSLSRASTTYGLDRSDSLPKYGRLYKTQTERLSSSIAAMESLQQTETDESRLVFDDAEYARQIAAEEEDDLRRRIEEKGRMEAERQLQAEAARQQQAEAERQQQAEAERQQRAEAERQQQAETEKQQQADGERLPQYTSDSLPPDPEVPISSQQALHTNETAPPPPPSAPVASSRPRVSSSEAVRHHSSLPFPLNQPNYDNRPQMPAVPSSSSVSSSVLSSQAGPSDGPSPPYGNRPHENSFSSATAGSSESSQPSQQASASAVNHHRFIDRELLTGVSIGFKPPILSNRLVAMEDPMPNIISLPATRCPPLHLHAPNWRHMLRLLARLSNSRIEATVEALSGSKADLKLRTVVQFVKSHPYGNIWRTILWFTIDHPVPPNVPGAGRYLSGNPNLLPWSYTLSPVPILLRDAADTPLSKTYTIPATDAVPLPTLPITFPNLAHYLQAALEVSRRNSRSSDSSSGLGKLGKMVQTCYPNVKEDDYDDDGPGKSSGVTDLFKRVIGRGNKDKKKGKSNNEETYTMVTPFLNDEWG